MICVHCNREYILGLANTCLRCYEKHLNEARKEKGVNLLLKDVLAAKCPELIEAERILTNYDRT